MMPRVLSGQIPGFSMARRAAAPVRAAGVGLSANGIQNLGVAALAVELAASGAVLGGVVGALVGGNLKSTAVGGAVGAVVGGAFGTYSGYEIKKGAS